MLLFLLLADILDAYGTFCFPCSFLKGQVHFFTQTVYNLKIDLTLFKSRFCFQDIGFILLKCPGICNVFEHVIIFIMDFFDMMTPAPRAQIAGGLTIYNFFNIDLSKK